MKRTRIATFLIMLLTIIYLVCQLKQYSEKLCRPLPKYSISVKEAYDSVQKKIDTNYWKLTKISNTLEGFCRQFKDSAVDIPLYGIQRNYESKEFMFEFIAQTDTIKLNEEILFPICIFVYGPTKETIIYYNDYIETDIMKLSDTFIYGFEKACYKTFNKSGYYFDIATFNTISINKQFFWEFKLLDVERGKINILMVNEDGEIDNSNDKKNEESTNKFNNINI